MFLTVNLCALVCRQRVRRCDRAEDRSPGEQPAHPAAPQLPLRQNGDADALPKRLALQLPASTSAQVRHHVPLPSPPFPGVSSDVPPRAMPGKRRVPKAAHVLSSSLPSPLHSWCQRCPWWFAPFLSSPSSFSPRPRWLKGNRTRTDETCSTPAQYRGQSIRDTPALRTCKLPTKRSKKGSRH